MDILFSRFIILKRAGHVIKTKGTKAKTILVVCIVENLAELIIRLFATGS